MVDDQNVNDQRNAPSLLGAVVEKARTGRNPRVEGLVDVASAQSEAQVLQVQSHLVKLSLPGTVNSRLQHTEH